MKSSCIDIDFLAGYIKGSLSDEDNEQVEEHLSYCDGCLEEFANATTLLKESEALAWEPVSEENAHSFLKLLNIPGQIKKFYKWISKKLPHDPFLHPGLAPARNGDGEESAVEYIILSKGFGDIHMEIYLEKEEADRFTVRTKAPKGSQMARNVRLAFMRQGGGVVSRLIKGEDVSFEPFPFGSYRLSLLQDAVEKGEYCFDINEEGLNEV